MTTNIYWKCRNFFYGNGEAIFLIRPRQYSDCSHCTHIYPHLYMTGWRAGSCTSSIPRPGYIQWLPIYCQDRYILPSESVWGSVCLWVGRWFPPGTPVSSTRKLISSSFHRLDMTLAVAEALTPNKPNQTCVGIFGIFQYQWWRNPEYPEETTDVRQVTDKMSHIQPVLSPRIDPGPQWREARWTKASGEQRLPPLSYRGLLAVFLNIWGAGGLLCMNPPLLWMNTKVEGHPGWRPSHGDVMWRHITSPDKNKLWYSTVSDLDIRLSASSAIFTVRRIF